MILWWIIHVFEIIDRESNFVKSYIAIPQNMNSNLFTNCKFNVKILFRKNEGLLLKFS